jgi:hypothetical protein|tara:strand:- start:519 stop:932 length:414 start_codon:yes stop_codon:yes gene_type:complete
MRYDNELINYNIEYNSNIIEISEDDIIEIDDMLAGFIYVKKNWSWKKKYFVICNNSFEYWKSNKNTKQGRKRVKEKYFEFDNHLDLSCLKRVIYNNKIAWVFKIYKNDKLMRSFLSYNQKVNDVYNKMKNGIYLLND